MTSIFRRRKEDHPQFYATVGEGLKKIYKSKLLPLEEAYEFHEFISPPLNDPDFDAKPMILFVGQYSTGKTSLIRLVTMVTMFPIKNLFVNLSGTYWKKSIPDYVSVLSPQPTVLMP